MNLENFIFENMNHITTIKRNRGKIYCIKTLDDGRLAAGDSNSDLIIYNNKTFNPEIIIQNNLDCLWNFTQLKNHYIACSFSESYTFKIIKNVNNNNENENQIIKKAHNEDIFKIIELKNENLITFSLDNSFKIWKFNNNTNIYEQIYVFLDINILSDGLEIEENEIILYALGGSSKLLVFYNLNKKEKIKTLNNLNLYIDCVGNRIIKLNNDEVIVTGYKKVYLIDIKNYLILNEIDFDCFGESILKLSNNLFLIGDEIGRITQYKIENKNIIEESCIINYCEKNIWSMTLLNNMIISVNGFRNEIKIWNK